MATQLPRRLREMLEKMPVHKRVISYNRGAFRGAPQSALKSARPVDSVVLHTRNARLGALESTLGANPLLRVFLQALLEKPHQGCRNVSFGKWCFRPLTKTRGFEENGENYDIAVYLQEQGVCSPEPRKRRKWRVSLTQNHRLPKATSMLQSCMFMSMCCSEAPKEHSLPTTHHIGAQTPYTT